MRSHEDLAEVRHPLAENSVAALVREHAALFEGEAKRRVEILEEENRNPPCSNGPGCSDGLKKTRRSCSR